MDTKFTNQDLVTANRKKPEISSNASETRHLVPFAILMLQQYTAAFGTVARLLLKAGQALEAWYKLIEDYGTRMCVLVHSRGH